jgi:hypothetical protein
MHIYIYIYVCVCVCVCVCVWEWARVFYFWVFPNESALKRGSTERGYNPAIIIIRYC